MIENSKMKIIFAGRWDPGDKKAWSGIYYYVYHQLLQTNEVNIFIPQMPWLPREKLLLQKKFNKTLFHKQTLVEYLTAYAKQFSKQLDSAIAKQKPDLVFVPAAPQLTAYLQSSVPVIYMTDATFKQLHGYYDAWNNITAANEKQALTIDKSAFQKAAHSLVASDWCMQSAINDYEIGRNKITVAPMGANLDRIPAAVNLNRNMDTCRLLFLGVEWERKGGDIALAAFRHLKKIGIKSTLHIIGCVPPVNIDDADVSVIPFLDKKIPAENERLYSILADSHFLLLPTRAECAGIVFCEAAAYGTASISTDTGGVSTYVRNGVNGYLLPPGADAAAYGEKIATVFLDKAAYQSLTAGSRQLYESTLNWNSWADTFNEVASTLVK
jgi:glycosyltransferase involved in cell wall biosynthesis